MQKKGAREGQSNVFKIVNSKTIRLSDLIVLVNPIMKAKVKFNNYEIFQ